jgi:hypothetical protein
MRSRSLRPMSHWLRLGQHSPDDLVLAEGLDAENLRRLVQVAADLLGLLGVGGDLLEHPPDLGGVGRIRDAHVDYGPRPVLGAVGNVIDASIRDEVHRPVDVSQARNSQRQLLDLARRLLVDLNDVAHAELVLEQDEESVHDVLDEILSPEADREADDPHAREERREVVAEAR